MNNLYNKINRELTDKETQMLDIFYQDAQNLIKLHIKKLECPAELLFIAEDVAISRFRKVGAEAVSAEGVDGVSFTYIADPLGAYKDFLDAYISKSAGRLVTF